MYKAYHNSNLMLHIWRKFKYCESGYKNLNSISFLITNSKHKEVFYPASINIKVVTYIRYGVSGMSPTLKSNSVQYTV